MEIDRRYTNKSERFGAFAMERRRYVTLDALRGVAAMAVALMHISIRWPPILAPSAYLAVDFFFILSGFVVGEAYDRRLREGMGAGAFAIVRLIRLWPMIVLGGLLAGTYVLARGGAGGRADLVRALVGTLLGILILPSPASFTRNGWLYSVNQPEWSLLFELVANFIYGAAARWLTATRLAIVAAVGAALLLASGLAAGDLNIGASWFDGAAGSARVLFGFSVGLLLQRAPRLHRIDSDAAIVAVAAVLAAIMFAPRWGAAFELAMVLLVFPPLVWIASSIEPRRLSVAASRLGAASYPLYAVHFAIAYWAAFMLHRLPVSGVPTWMACGVVLAFATGVALAAERFWDIPIRAALTRLARRPTGLAAAQTAAETAP